ncbi:serine protease, S1-C subfamily, contains C-terminal PDZ domain [Opitutus sp. GAS368]|nr:serine protease, S1-C subfamily, contains C-terminal PDZ domain [Opitutus sp. GAS368]
MRLPGSEEQRNLVPLMNILLRPCRALAPLIFIVLCLTGQLAAQTPTTNIPPPANPPAATPKTPAEPGVSGVENSVVKVFSTVRYPDLYRPWTKQAPSELTGSGVVIEGKRILTNAHVVLYASQVQIQASQAGDKISASVVAVAPGIDLAVLKLDDETFFDTHAPLARANTLPDVKDAVMAYGFPTGGTSLSITKGIVSRIEFVPYNFPTSGLRIQIDAAINPGNSGGPAIAGDKMIGLAFSTLNNTQNIGYIIPNEEIDFFLRDIARGPYQGKPAMFDELQTLENPALRAYLKLDKSVEGIVVHEPYESDPAYPLKEWDVITKVGDTSIDDQGMIKLGSNLRVRFQYRIQQIAQNGKVPLTLVRTGRELKVDLPVSPDRPMLIPDLKDAYPSYFVFGPLVFSKATAQLLGSFSANANLVVMLSAIRSPLAVRRSDKPAFPDEELVILSSPFFPHRLAKGYGPHVGHVLKTVNGTAVRNLRHLVGLLRDSADEFITLEFDNHGGEALVFPRKEMLAATDEILNDNGVRAQGSPDMLEVWNAKPAK